MRRLAEFSGQWPALSALLDEALNLPASEHQTWLDSLAGEHAAHRDALRALLTHRQGVETDDFLGRLPQLDVAAAQSPADGLAPGSHVGAYRLIAEIGRGGMGTVWLAERSDGLMKRRVALKLPRVVWGDAFAERLGRERDILATLEHQHIARLYDAGVDAQGRPFLAMEHVEGQSIDAWCRAHAPSVRGRIALLLQVMAAVAHAHARLVVHRDLKPGNILVTPAGEARLLDFGIAKLMESGRTRDTALTELAGRALTLDYASPEQIRGEPLGTASDIYSMAVVAYEVLAGVRPYRLKRASAAELEEAIATVEPPLASRSAADPRVARQLRGDLDAILNQALKKTPGERYPTMDAFAHDLQRHLQGEPVQARPDGWRYRAAKFVRRHRLQVAAGVAVTAALVAGTSVALWQAREAGLSAQRAQAEAARARVEAATAKAVQGFIESVFTANSKYQPDPRKAGETTARTLLDRGAERIATDLASEPEAQLRLYYLLAEMYGGMWQFESSLALFRRALDLATRLHGPGSDAALRASAAVGHMLDDLGQRDEALAVMLKADAAAGRRATDADPVRMQIDAELARLYIRTDLPKALERARRAAAIARALGPSLEGIDALQILGEVSRTAEQPGEARDALVEALAWSDRFDARGVQGILLAELGKAQERLGQLEAAAATLARAVVLSEQLGDTAVLHNARFELARFQVRNRLLRDFLDTARPEVDWARAQRQFAESRHLPAQVMANYGRALVAYGDAARGLNALDQARALLPPETPASLHGQFIMARASALVALSRLPEAGADIERAAVMMAGRGERIAEEGRVIRRRYLVAAGKAGEALQDFNAHPPPVAAPGTKPNPLLLLPRRIEEATLLLAAGQAGAAHAAAASALALIDGLPERRFAGDAEARLTAVLGESLLHDGRAADALPVLQKSLALQLAQYDPHSPAVADTRLALAKAQRSVSR